MYKRQSHDTNLYAIWFILFCFCGRLSPPRFLCCHSCLLYTSDLKEAVRQCRECLASPYLMPSGHTVGENHAYMSVSYTHLWLWASTCGVSTLFGSFWASRSVMTSCGACLLYTSQLHQFARRHARGGDTRSDAFQVADQRDLLADGFRQIACLLYTSRCV